MTNFFFSAVTVLHVVQQAASFGLSPLATQPAFSTSLSVGDARGDYYGESAGSFVIKEFSSMEQLEEVVKLASCPLPERPDGIVCVAKFTSSSAPEAKATEAEFERMAQKNPATLHLRCFSEYEDSNILFGRADVTVIPTFDIFYGGNRVARVEGSNHVEVEELLDRYQFQNSRLDLFSEVAPEPWGEGKAKPDNSKTPRTTNRFVPGYDWNSDKGFFDTAADKAASDFENQYGNWLPNTEDE
mmetsp:Transcript_2295/g.3158  ORF Transcript_2295/g.3158 Transcript_2295/m.3158 type:complete len:243 (-) Transcript_2295:85-813(-)